MSAAPRHRRPPRRRGFALLLVLLAVAGLFALAMNNAAATRATVIESTVLRDRAAALREARSAVVLAVVGMVSPSARGAEDAAEADGDDPGPAAPPTPEIERELPPLLREMLKASGVDLDKEAAEVPDSTGGGVIDGGGVTGRTPARQDVRVLELIGLPTRPVEIEGTRPGERIRITFRDAAGQISLNTADAAQLERYFTAIDVDARRARNIASQIIDWRDPDDFRSDGGAEQAEYARLGVQCRNDLFAAVEELLYLPAMDADLFERIRHDFSVGGGGMIHAGTATRAVLMSLDGVTSATADSIIALREAGPMDEQELQRTLGIAGRKAFEQMRVKNSNAVRIVAEVFRNGRVAHRFEGMAVLDGRGIASLGLLHSP